MHAMTNRPPIHKQMPLRPRSVTWLLIPPGSRGGLIGHAPQREQEPSRLAERPKDCQKGDHPLPERLRS